MDDSFRTWRCILLQPVLVYSHWGLLPDRRVTQRPAAHNCDPAVTLVLVPSPSYNAPSQQKTNTATKAAPPAGRGVPLVHVLTHRVTDRGPSRESSSPHLGIFSRCRAHAKLFMKAFPNSPSIVSQRNSSAVVKHKRTFLWENETLVLQWHRNLTTEESGVIIVFAVENP